MKKNIQKYFPLLLLIILISMGSLFSCKKFLDAKPNQKLAVPASLTEIQILLDNYFTFNNLYPSSGEVASDDYYITDAVWAAVSSEHTRDTYRWQANDTYTGEWAPAYKRIYTANVILEFLDQLDPSPADLALYNNLKGSALFFRAYSFFTLAQVFTPPYSAATASTELGLPLRLNSDYTEQSMRSSMEQTYMQMIYDLNDAADLLPIKPQQKSRPSKPAVYGALARIYQVMQDHNRAGSYADSTLLLVDDLLNYNMLNSTASFPVSQNNNEVILDAMMLSTTTLAQSRWKVDTILYQSYSDYDLRKKVFYKANSDGSHTFKGSYTGTGIAFAGITTSEILLIRAEAHARNGHTDKAMNDLNLLLEHRLQTGNFIPLTVSNSQLALQLVLSERRKELVYRNLRWMDLRRLSLEPSHAITPKRWLQGQWYVLEPSSPRYTQLIPYTVIEFSNMPQNP